jgi:branched-chain amino acid transport system ATP-binding protein
MKDDAIDTKILEVRNLTKRFGGVTANDRVSLEIQQGELVALIGPNGAGKSTLFKTICGIPPKGGRPGPDEGRIFFKGQDITHLKAHAICRMGLALVFQETETLKTMTVLENVAMGALCHCSSFHKAKRLAEEHLDFMGLSAKNHVLAGDLTIAERKRLELARSLATKPSLLMLDEVMAGLTLKEVQDAVALIKQIHATGVTIVLIEHVLEAVMAISQRIIVLEQGRKIADDRPENIVKNPEVIRAYLGGELNHA